ncbi:hypothetical protein EVAR_82816_1 [Eumeta japonica]|uniref:Uncharacterized protein n=1 Tax=Eumeta variegata TaxID=151549 RepID=A0A4C1V354_EUMVA|nr:hypothetical protein EVAR_82816_1 [Eumeta japonica]
MASKTFQRRAHFNAYTAQGPILGAVSEKTKNIAIASSGAGGAAVLCSGRARAGPRENSHLPDSGGLRLQWGGFYCVFASILVISAISASMVGKFVRVRTPRTILYVCVHKSLYFGVWKPRGHELWNEFRSRVKPQHAAELNICADVNTFGGSRGRGPSRRIGFQNRSGPAPTGRYFGASRTSDVGGAGAVLRRRGAAAAVGCRRSYAQEKNRLARNPVWNRLRGRHSAGLAEHTHFSSGARAPWGYRRFQSHPDVDAFRGPDGPPTLIIKYSLFRRYYPTQVWEYFNEFVLIRCPADFTRGPFVNYANVTAAGGGEQGVTSCDKWAYES